MEIGTAEKIEKRETGETTGTAEVLQAWHAYQTVEKRGLDFGRVCYEQRAKAEVVQGGTTFGHTLDILGIPRRTAYYWIRSYEISIGVREPDEPVKPGIKEPDEPTTAAIDDVEAITDAVNFPADFSSNSRELPFEYEEYFLTPEESGRHPLRFPIDVCGRVVYPVERASNLRGVREVGIQSGQRAVTILPVGTETYVVSHALDSLLRHAGASWKLNLINSLKSIEPSLPHNHIQKTDY